METLREVQHQMAQVAMALAVEDGAPVDLMDAMYERAKDVSGVNEDLGVLWDAHRLITSTEVDDAKD